jgi:acyl-CoA thioester hydrolase
MVHFRREPLIHIGLRRKHSNRMFRGLAIQAKMLIPAIFHTNTTKSKLCDRLLPAFLSLRNIHGSTDLHYMDAVVGMENLPLAYEPLKDVKPLPMIAVGISCFGMCVYRSQLFHYNLSEAVLPRSELNMNSLITSNTITIRVRYVEADAMGYLHHSRYLQYFEMGRIELMRAMGGSYAEMEKSGHFFVVAKAGIRFRAPARFDEELTLTTRIVRRSHVRFDHGYELKRGETLIAEGTTTIACVGRDGQLQVMPAEIHPK